MATEQGFTYALIDAAGEVKPVRSQTPAWLESFARHHRVAFTEKGRSAVSTVFLGCGQLDEDGRVRCAFETIRINAQGRYGAAVKADTAEEALRNHGFLADR